MASTAATRSSTDAMPRTVALSVARLAVAADTPGTAWSARSTRAMHDAQVMPSTASSTVVGGTSYPAFSMALTSAIRSTGPDTRTSARSVARFTATPATPSTLARADSTRPTQDAQVMPSTGRLIVVGARRATPRAAASRAPVSTAGAPGAPSRASLRSVAGLGEDTSIMESSLNPPTMGRSSGGRKRPRRQRLGFRRRNPLRMAVDDVSTGPQEGDQGEPARAGELDRQRGGRGDRGEQADAEPRGLGDHLVAGAAGDQDEAGAQVGPLADEGAEQLVERVVSADVLAHEQDLAIGAGPGRRMDRAG